jgi:hypothetical protein
VLQVEEEARRARAGAGKPAGGVAAQAAAARRGGAGRSQRRLGKRWVRALEGTWREEERRGGSWGSGNGRRRWRGHGRREKQREGGAGG